MSILIRNARVLTMDDQDTEHLQADILIQGTQISTIAPGLPIPSDSDLRIIEAEGLLAMPGLINGHLHSPGNFMKGALDGAPLEIFMLYEVPPLSDAVPSPRLNYVRTMLGAIEMLKLGITTVHDDAFFVPVPTPDAIDGIAQAYTDSGIRATITLDQPNVVEYDKFPFLRALLPDKVCQQMENAPRQSGTELLELYGHLIERWHGSQGGRIKAALSCSAPQRVTVEYFQALSQLSKTLDLPLNVHVLETKLQRVLGQEKYGKSLIRYLHDLELLDERLLIIHAIWIDEQDLDLMAAAGCSVAHNPICNLKLGSGIMPFRQIRRRGINICLGSDEACSDDSFNLWSVAKLTGLIHNITDPDYRTWVKAPEVLWAMLRGGAKAMRLDRKIGRLASGYEADLILLDLNTLTFTPLNDLRRQLIYCEQGSSVVMTIVAGQVVVENGKVLTVDEESVKAEVRELMTTYYADLKQLDSEAQQLEPYYQKMYFQAAAADLGMNRWANGKDTNQVNL